MMVKGDMLVYLAKSDWRLVSILTFIFGRTTEAGLCANAKKNTEKQKEIRQSKREQRKDQEDNYILVERSVYSARLGLIILISLTKLLLTLILTFIYKMT